jgi:hypothetical protein
MDVARREWVEHLVEVCDGALARLAEREDADRVLVADLEELRERLRAELKGG